MRLPFENVMKNHSIKNAVLEKVTTEARMTTFVSNMRIFRFQLIQHMPVPFAPERYICDFILSVKVDIVSCMEKVCVVKL